MTIIATLKEIKDNENRVGLTPAGVKELVSEGHKVIVQTHAGEGSGFEDSEYSSAGAELLNSPMDIVKQTDIIIKVKEPVPSEYNLLDNFKGKTLFTYLHLAGVDKKLTSKLLENKITAIAYETVEDKSGEGPRLPLLAPMSEVAGVLAIQYGAEYLQKKYGGFGKTLGMIKNTLPAKVVVVGGGVVGSTSARTATGLGCKVVLIEKSEKRIIQLKSEFKSFFGETLFENISFKTPEFLVDEIKDAEVVVGAVLIPGAKAPLVVTEDMIKSMKNGSVVVDVAIDQGGSVWGSKPTSHSKPIYELDGKIFCCVTNMPGQVPRQSTQALTSATLPYLMKLAVGVDAAIIADLGLKKGVNTQNGTIRFKAVAEELGMLDNFEE